MKHAVVKEYDFGKFEVVKPGLSLHEAQKIAGQLRDAMTDAEVGRSVDDGWSYQARYVGHRKDLIR